MDERLSCARRSGDRIVVIISDCENPGILRVVTTAALGAPVAALAVFVAPIAPEPLVPVASAPVKLRTVIDEITLCETVAVTVAFDNTEGAKARHTSEVPL